MTQPIVTTSEFMRSAAELAVGGCAMATGMVVMPVAAPAFGIAALFGAKAVGKWIQKQSECEAAINAVLGQVSREFPNRHEADPAAVKAAQKALAAALKVEGLFSQERLTEAWNRGGRLSEALAALALGGVEAHDTSFAAPGLRHDLARDVLEAVFAAAVTCSVFREMATLTGVETAVGQGRALADQMSEMEARLAALISGEDDPSIRKLRAELDARMDELGIIPEERRAWLANWVGEIVTALRDAGQPTNEGADFDALKLRAMELLVSDPAKASAPFLSALERDAAEDRQRQVERRRHRDRLYEEAIETDTLALRFDAAVATLWKQAEENENRPGTAWVWFGNRINVMNSEAERFPGLSRLLFVEAAYRLLLIVCNRSDRPTQWAATQNNLGIVLRRLGERAGGATGVQALNEAVEAYRAALEVYTRTDMPADWAMMQNNLGTTLQTLGERAGDDAGVRAINDAVAAYNAALEVYTQTDTPADWAMTQNNLGIALGTLGARSGGEAGVQALNEAVAAYRAALEVYTQTAMPAEWAMTQNNLGNALSTLGDRAGGEAVGRALNDAVAAYRSALEVYTRADMPTQWARTQNNLGNALRGLGARTRGEASVRVINEAMDAYRAALEVFTRADMPVQWAMASENLHIVAASRSWITRDSAPVCAAADAMAEVIAVFEEMEADYYVDKARANRARMIALCRELGGRCQGQG